MSSSLSQNPLIISLVNGLSLSLTGIRILQPLSDTLHMIGSSTTPVALFMLEVFLYGRRYEKIRESIAYLSIRAIGMPVLTFLVSPLVGLPHLETTVLVLMYSTPLAVSMIVLSERYGFHEETISSTILVTSLLAGLYMNIWIALLEYLF